MLRSQLFHRALSHAARIARKTVQLARQSPGPESLPSEHDAPPPCPETFEVAPSPTDTDDSPSPTRSIAPPPTASNRAASTEPTGAVSQQPAQRVAGAGVETQVATCDPRPSTADDESSPALAHHERGLALARAHRWNWAQRELELAVRLSTETPPRDDLETVRAARRYLRALRKNPRDARTHVLLGKCYFELEMEEDAEREFRQAITLAPDEPEPHYFLALEYCFRGMTAEAEQHYARAQRLVDGLPPFSEFLAEYQQLVENTTGE